MFAVACHYSLKKIYYLADTKLNSNKHSRQNSVENDEGDARFNPSNQLSRVSSVQSSMVWPSNLTKVGSLKSLSSSPDEKEPWPGSLEAIGSIRRPKLTAAEQRLRHAMFRGSTDLLVDQKDLDNDAHCWKRHSSLKEFRSRRLSDDPEKESRLKNLSKSVDKQRLTRHGSLKNPSPVDRKSNRLEVPSVSLLLLRPLSLPDIAPNSQSADHSKTSSLRPISPMHGGPGSALTPLMDESSLKNALSIHRKRSLKSRKQNTDKK